MRAWLYYRLSRDENEEMNSLQNQRQILVDYAEQNGYEIVGESFDDNVVLSISLDTFYSNKNYATRKI